MAKNKTTENQNSVTAFFRTVANEQKRKETAAIIDLFSEYTGYEPKMGERVLLASSYHYKYESGRKEMRHWLALQQEPMQLHSILDQNSTTETHCWQTR